MISLDAHGARWRAPRTVRPAFVRLVAVALIVAGWALLPGPVAAHGDVPEPGSFVSVLLAWQLELWIVVPLVVAALVYAWAAGRVTRAHAKNPVPRYRQAAWYAGLLVIFLALESPIGTYDTTFFFDHMIEHLMLLMAATPLLAIGAPITLLLRVATPAVRQRWILPVLHSRLVRLISFPVTTWLVFAAVLWATHFSPLYNASLTNDAIHAFEHGLYVVAGLLFWWPVVGADPSPWRLPHGGRVLYLFLGMPQSAFLGLAIYSAPDVLYSHYATLSNGWGLSPLADQAWAGAIMWLGGDMMFFVALILAVWVWLRAEEAEGVRIDAKLDRELARQQRLEETRLP